MTPRMAAGVVALAVCLQWPSGQAVGESNTTDIVTRPAAELADLSLTQLMELQVPTVVGASKHEQKTTEAPAEITVITADDIKKYGYRTLADILRSVPGMYVVYDHSYGSIGTGGFNLLGDYGGRVLLLLDGHRLNDPIYDTAANVTDFIVDVDLIERVEVIKGPGSSLYGNNALFAVINVVTRPSRSFNGAETSGSAGTYNTYQGRASYGKRFANGLEVVISGTTYTSQGDRRLFFKDFNNPADNNGVAVNLDDDQFNSVFGHVTWQDLSLESAYITRTKQAPNAEYGTVFNNPNFTTTDDRGYVELKYAHDFDDFGAVLARVYYDHYGYRANYPYNNVIPSDPTAIVLNRDEQGTDWVGGEVQWSRTLWERHRLTLGAEYDYYYKLQLSNFNISPPEVFQQVDRSQYSAGVYAQDEYRVLDQLVLNAGLRYDYFYGDSQVDPRVALIWDPRTGTTLKAIYATAYRAPNAYESDYVSNATVNNQSLKPETVTSFELIWEQAYGEHWRSVVSGFYTEAHDLIGHQTDTNGVSSFTNLNDAHSKGVDVSLSSAWENGLRGRVSYTYADAEGSDGHLHNSPANLGKANLIVPVIGDKLFAGFEVLYNGSRTTSGGASLSDFWVANITLFSQPLGKHWEISGSVYNVFDRHYSDPAADVPESAPQDGRTFRIKLTGRF